MDEVRFWCVAILLSGCAGVAPPKPNVPRHYPARSTEGVETIFTFDELKIEDVELEDWEVEEIIPKVEEEEEKALEEIRSERAAEGFQLEKDPETLRIERALEVEFDIPVRLDSKVAYFIWYFTTVQRNVFKKWLERAPRYIPIMREILKEHDLPEDLVYLAMIESGFSARAISRARAVGPWQFIKSTAKRYNLRVDWWVDERRDPIKSTHAAAKYLKDLYKMFGSWHLAAAAYNAGERRIEKALRKIGASSYWEIQDVIPRETRDYVPKMIAAAIIAKKPEKFGFNDLKPLRPLNFDEIIIRKQVDIWAIARAAGCSVWDIVELNPSLRRVVTPPYTFTLKVPRGKGEIVARFIERSKPKPRVYFVKYRVRRGDTLSTIARKFRTTVRDIMKLNKLKSTRIFANQYLNIPASTAMFYKKTAKYRARHRYTYARHIGNKFITYRVKRGDSLWSIAKKFGVSVQQLKKLNKLKNSKIYPGKVLVVKRSVSAKYSSTSIKFITYRVKRGDSLWSIAKKFGVSVQQLKKLNKLKNSKIYPGKVLVVKRSVGGDNMKYYRVKRGDTIYTISRRFGVDMRKVIRINNLSSPHRIYPGQVLKIPRT